MSKKLLEELFPALAVFGYKILSRPTDRYDCVAWAAGDTTRWWWPDLKGKRYWPENVERKRTLDVFKKVFENLGYFICDNGNFEEGYDKIAIYVNENGKPTHVTRQFWKNVWISKIGEWELVEYYNVNALYDGICGDIAVFMKRPIKYLSDNK